MRLSKSAAARIGLCAEQNHEAKALQFAKSQFAEAELKVRVGDQHCSYVINVRETLERAAANRERERERAKVPRADESRSGLRRSVPAAVVQSSSTGNSQKAEPTETRKRPPAETAGEAPSVTVHPTAPKGVLVRIPEDQLAEFLKDQQASQAADQKKTADPVCETPAAEAVTLELITCFNSRFLRLSRLCEAFKILLSLNLPRSQAVLQL